MTLYKFTLIDKSDDMDNEWLEYDQMTEITNDDNVSKGSDVSMLLECIKSLQSHKPITAYNMMKKIYKANTPSYFRFNTWRKLK